MNLDQDLFQPVALQLDCGYDQVQGLLALVAEVGGHTSIMARRHKTGTYQLSVTVPKQHRKEFEPYETKP